MNNFSLKYLFIISVLSFINIGCQQADNNDAPQKLITDNSIIATDGEMKLTVAELEQHLLDLPVNLRWSTTDSSHWLKNTIGEYVVQKKLLKEAQLIGAQEEPKFKNVSHNLYRNAYTQQYMNGFASEFEGMGEEDLKRYYQEHIDEYQLPEKRMVHHIYKGNKHDDGKQQLEALKTRYENGENFMRLAEAHSDSETRHDQGRLGLLKKGDMSPDFDRVVFALALNQASDVIKTAKGHHLFVVTDILPEQSYEFEQVKNQITSQLVAKFGIDNLKAKALLLDTPEPMVLIDKTELMIMNKQPQKRGMVLQVGDYQLPYNQMMYELNELKKTTKMTIDQDKQWQYIQTVAYSEVIMQNLIKNGTILLQDEWIKKQQQKLLIDHYIDMKMVNHLNKKPQLLSEYFEKNRKRFSTPVRLKLQRLMIPKIDQLDAMPELELAIESLENKEMSLSDMALRYQGRVQNLGWKNVNQLASIDRQMLKYALLLKIGEFSPPFTNSNFYTILHLQDKKEPVEQEFLQVRQQVIKEYIVDHGADLYREISQELLQYLEIDTAVMQSFIDKKRQ